jgi:hypothetical protein
MDSISCLQDRSEIPDLEISPDLAQYLFAMSKIKEHVA